MKRKKIDDEMFIDICDKMAAGETLANICSDDINYCSRDAVYRYKRKNAENEQIFANAQEQSAHVIFDDIRELVNSMSVQNAGVRREQINALKWCAGKLHTRYADKSGIRIDNSKTLIASEESLTALKASQEDMTNRIRLNAQSRKIEPSEDDIIQQ